MEAPKIRFGNCSRAKCNFHHSIFGRSFTSPLFDPAGKILLGARERNRLISAIDFRIARQSTAIRENGTHNFLWRSVSWNWGDH
jgi:hypothetical protein